MLIELDYLISLKNAEKRLAKSQQKTEQEQPEKQFAEYLQTGRLLHIRA